VRNRWPFFWVVVVAIVFGVVVDWKQCPLTADGATNVLATLLLGWWLQHALQRDADLDQIPLSGVARAVERVEGLVNDCIDRATQVSSTVDPQLLTTLRLLNNEVDWLESQALKLGISAAERAAIFDSYVAVKGHLTREKVPDVRAAADEARNMRTQGAEVHWKIARQILVKGKARKLFEG